MRAAAAAAAAARVRPLHSAFLAHQRIGGSWTSMKQPAKVAQKGNIASFFTRQPKPAAAAEAGEGGAKAEAPSAASSPNENAAQAAVGAAKPAAKRKPEVRRLMGSAWEGLAA